MEPLTTWTSPPVRIALPDDTLHVWRIAVPSSAENPPPHVHDLLSATERHQAERLRVDAARARFVFAHAALRFILARYLDQKPEAIAFQHGPHGKPHVGHHRIRFNLSHSGAWILVGVGARHDIGIDIEEISARHNADAVAARFFSPHEQEAYRALPDPERRTAFFRCWSRKEAVIKALGDGLAFPLHRFDVGLDPDHPRLLALRRDGADAAAWTMIDIRADAGYAAAAAIVGPCRNAVGYDFTWQNGGLA